MRTVIVLLILLIGVIVVTGVLMFLTAPDEADLYKKREASEKQNTKDDQQDFQKAINKKVDDVQSNEVETETLKGKGTLKEPVNKVEGISKVKPVTLKAKKNDGNIPPIKKEKPDLITKQDQKPQTIKRVDQDNKVEDDN